MNDEILFILDGLSNKMCIFGQAEITSWSVILPQFSSQLHLLQPNKSVILSYPIPQTQLLDYSQSEIVQKLQLPTESSSPRLNSSQGSSKRIFRVKIV